MNKYFLFSLVFFLFSLLPWCIQGSCLSADTIIDTVYSSPELDGSISYAYDLNQYWISTVPTVFSCGDGWGGLEITYWWKRGYVSFPLPEIPIGFDLQSVYIYIYQQTAFGNEEIGVFPIWDVYPQPDTTECILDHIDYGYSLDIGDWTAGNPGDPQTLHTNIGILSDNAIYEYKTMDITEYVMDDYNNNRDKTQYRIRFWINTDWDVWRDGLTFISGNWTENRPYIRLVFSNVYVIEENLSSNNFLNTYPNPFNSEINIEYSMDCSNINLEIYNIKGQKVHSQMNLPAIGSVVWKCGAQTSGIYLIKISNSKQKYIKKITYLK